MKFLAGLLLAVCTVVMAPSAMATSFDLYSLSGTAQHADVDCQDKAVDYHKNDGTFCGAFEHSAKCHCEDESPFKNMCDDAAGNVDMTKIYNNMVQFYGSVDGACTHAEAKGYETKQTCLDDWQCYRTGGTVSDGTQCQQTGASCAA